MRTHRDPGRDAGSLPMAMLLMLVGMSMGALLLPVLVANSGAARTDADRAHALQAAQAGIDVLVGRIRAATDSGGNGVTSMLPGPELTGSVNPDGSERYRVSVTYYGANGAAVSVVGVANPPQPTTAVLISIGVQPASVDPRPGVNGARTLQATYRFRTSNENIPGGMIPVNGEDPSQPSTLCIAVGSRTPAVGSVATVQPCTAGDPYTRRFAYTRNLTIQLWGSEQTTPNGLCLQGEGDPSSATYKHVDGQRIVVAACAAVTSPTNKLLWAQQWSLQNYGNFIGTTDGVKVDGFCLNVATPGTPSNLVVGDKAKSHCQVVGYNNRMTFLPEPTVGAGWAGASDNWIGNGAATAARQLVSVGPQQFGRCLDIAGATPDATKAGFMHAWPCKQAPDHTQTAWNQMWILPAVDPVTHSGTGVIKARANMPGTVYDGKDYCLQSYGTAKAPFVVECPTGVPTPDVLWTVYANTGTYGTSYVIRESTTPAANLCLTPAGPNPTPADLSQNANGVLIFKVVLRTCDGSQWQKWNAPPFLNDASPVFDFIER